MKILILQASPRANGNTAWMAEEYKNAAEAAGHASIVTRKATGLASRKTTCRSSIH